MLTASEELRKSLTDMPMSDLFRLLNKVRVIQAACHGEKGPWRVQFNLDHGRFDQAISEDTDEARACIEQVICLALATEHTATATFARLCRETGVLTDAARTLDMQRMGSEAAAASAKSAAISATASTASEKHAATSNRIAVKANRFSLLAVIVAVGALAVAIWALLEER